MTGRAARFVLAPVVDGAVDWTRSTDLVIAPIPLSKPVHVRLPVGPRPGGVR